MSFEARRRVRLIDQYVQISNAFLRDETLSIAARGMGAYLLTNDPTFVVSAARLGQVCGTGRDKTRKLIQELEDAGYLVRDSTQRGEGTGQFVPDRFLMSDEKNATSEPVTGNPATVNPAPVNPHPKKNNSKNTNEEPQEVKILPSELGEPASLFSALPAENPKDKSAGTAEVIESEFAAWWEVWPKKLAKPAALKAFRAARRRGHPAAVVLAGAQELAARWSKMRPDDRQYVPYPATWLNQERWMDETANMVAAAPLPTAVREDWFSQQRASGASDAIVPSE